MRLVAKAGAFRTNNADRGAGPMPSREALIALLVRAVAAGMRCPRCGKRMTWDFDEGARNPGTYWVIDHRVPVVRGGQHAVENLEIVCTRCDAVKGGS